MANDFSTISPEKENINFLLPKTNPKHVLQNLTPLKIFIGGKMVDDMGEAKAAKQKTCTYQKR